MVAYKIPSPSKIPTLVCSIILSSDNEPTFYTCHQKFVLHVGNLNGSIMQLFSGMCEDAFGQELGFFHFNDVYQFEGGSGQAWTAWDGTPPVITTEDAFCGRHSLYVSFFPSMRVYSKKLSQP